MTRSNTPKYPSREKNTRVIPEFFGVKIKQKIAQNVPKNVPRFSNLRDSFFKLHFICFISVQSHVIHQWKFIFLQKKTKLSVLSQKSKFHRTCSTPMQLGVYSSKLESEINIWVITRVASSWICDSSHMSNGRRKNAKTN